MAHQQFPADPVINPNSTDQCFERYWTDFELAERTVRESEFEVAAYRTIRLRKTEEP
jgi:hypothetical protein